MDSQKLYQLIITRLDGLRIGESRYSQAIFDLVDKGLGGVIIFGGRKEDVSGFINILQKRAKVPLFISSDIERGVGQQIEGYSHFPCPMAVASAIDRNNPQDVLMLRRSLHFVFLEAIECGINMPLLPVMDVNHNPKNPIICTRAFSDDPEIVGFFGAIYIKEMINLGLFACAKHFPGHGDTEIDSHLKLPEINRSYEDIMRMDIAPFRRAIDIGVSSIMAGHIRLPEIDKEPASLSGVILRDILRKECGFDGLILTDALNMGALNSISDVSVKAINGGADVLLHPCDAKETVLELERGINENRLDINGIDESIVRIMRLKTGIKDIKREVVERGVVNNLSQDIVSKSIALIKGTVPLIKGKALTVTIAGDNRGFDISTLGYGGSSPHIELFLDGLKNSYLISTTDLNQGIAFKGRSVIIMIISEIKAWRGTSGIPEGDEQAINQIIKDAKECVVISFGSPYILSRFKEASALIAAYEFTGLTLRAAAKCLTGESNFMGRLPVKIG